MIFIIGGESIYRQMLPYCNKAYVTKFHFSFEKDAYMPDLDAESDWNLTKTGEVLYSNEETDSVKDLPFVFAVYEKTPISKGTINQ